MNRSLRTLAPPGLDLLERLEILRPRLPDCAVSRVQVVHSFNARVSIEAPAVERSVRKERKLMCGRQERGKCDYVITGLKRLAADPTRRLSGKDQRHHGPLKRVKPPPRSS